MSRSVVGATAVLTLTASESSGAEVDPDSVDFTITRLSDGADFTDDGSLAGPTDHQHTLTVNGDAVSQLDTLIIEWTITTGAQSSVSHDLVELVGDRYFTLAEARSSDPSLADTTKYPTSELAARRLEVETEAEAICRRSFVPRYATVVLSGNGGPRLLIPHQDVRAIRMVETLDSSGNQWQFTADQVAAVRAQHGSLVRLGGTWPTGAANITIGLEHGLDSPPEDVRQAAIMRLRSMLSRSRSGVPDRVVSYSNDLGTFRNAVPGANRTGIPDVDAAYQRWAIPQMGFA